MAARNTRPEQDCGCDAPRIEPRLEPVLAITGDSEADRLWKHAMVGTGTCVGLIEQYVSVGMPRPPLNHIAGLHDRLGKVLACLAQSEVERVQGMSGGPLDRSVEPPVEEPTNESVTASNEL